MIDFSISCMWIPVKLEIFITGFKCFKIFQANSLGYFEAGVLLEDNGLLAFFEDLDLFAVPEIKSSKYQHT